MNEGRTGGMTMRVLMINHFPLAGSGSGTYTKNLAIHLAAIGYEVCIVLPENTDEIESIPGVRLHPVFFSPCDASVTDSSDAMGTSMEDALPFNFPCFTSHPRSVTTFGDLNEAQMKQYRGAFSAAIAEEVEAHCPDVIHGQHVWILPSLAAGLGIPLVLTAHGTDLMGYDKWPNLCSCAREAMDACYAVISISKDNCVLLEERFPEHKDKIVMMRNGYDPGMFYPEEVDREGVLSDFGIAPEEYEGKKIVSFAGKLTNFKGVDVLLDAVSLYEREKPDTLTLIIGDGDERDALHAQAKRLRLKSVRFLGNVQQQTLRRLYNTADVNLVPSRREPFGLVAIEAMACGIPVIASNEGGLPDFVNDSVGALVTPEDPQDLARAVREVLAREESTDFSKWRKEIAHYAREHYAQDRIIRELDALYRKAL